VEDTWKQSWLPFFPCEVGIFIQLIWQKISIHKSHISFDGVLANIAQKWIILVSSLPCHFSFCHMEKLTLISNLQSSGDSKVVYYFFYFHVKRVLVQSAMTQSLISYTSFCCLSCKVCLRDSKLAQSNK
jgi:hypothetical protein